ncbi:nucleoid-associated protein [Sporomusa sp. KB1]|jgi:hypothetical protein|uniref:nucleoid-associated protein n=1 Tax=Sporomusa sp. KB1 TaxID=943346 RepID=UPI00119F8970|nr:nucleoid-associated protein [Sporomusa sp. KB1]TWH45931.1 nucleoid associated protein NdpA [Sporomusa sp. KB1]
MIDFSLMSIDKIIIHNIPNALKGTAPTFSTELLELDQQALDVLATRITTVMGRGSNCVEMQLSDTTDVSAAHQFISIMTDPSDATFISKTSSLAQKLYQAQSNNRIPDGILVCINGRTGASQQQFVAAIKAESQSGFHVSSISSVQFLADLFLTEAQRLYKIGFCVRTTINPPTTNDLSMYVFDQNAIHSGTVAMANYFSQAFLGCKMMENAARQTEVFYETTKDFIMKNPSFDDEKKVDLTNSLHTYLKNDQSTIINGQLFANTYFEDPEIIDQYNARLTKEHFPSASVTKDTSRIKRKLKFRRMKFNSGIRISFPPNSSEENMDDFLLVDSYNKATDFTTVKIKGRIESQ